MLSVFKKTGLSWCWISVLVVFLDQLSKYAVMHHFTYGESFPVLPILNITLRFNPGAAFSFLGSAGGWQILFLSGISIIATIFLIGWLSKITRQNRMIAIPLTLILGGAIGNLIDRLRFGWVVDFIDFHWHAWHFATFNVADMGVSIGAALFILGLFYEGITRKS